MIFRIDLKIFIFLLILYFTRQIEIYLLMMIFAFLHEMGHLLAGILLKKKVKKISIMPAGFSIEFALTKEDYNKKVLNSNMNEVKKIIISIVGPTVNLILILLILVLKLNTEFANNIIYSNLIIAIFNLLPIYPLDGGRILKSIFCLKINRKKAILYTNRISNITLFLITFLFSILIYSWRNWAIIVVLIYLWYIVLNENKICNMKLKLYEELEKMQNILH